MAFPTLKSGTIVTSFSLRCDFVNWKCLYNCLPQIITMLWVGSVYIGVIQFVAVRSAGYFKIEVLERNCLMPALSSVILKLMSLLNTAWWITCNTDLPQRLGSLMKWNQGSNVKSRLFCRKSISEYLLRVFLHIILNIFVFKSDISLNYLVDMSYFWQNCKL